MLTPLTVYITVEQEERLRKEGNKSAVVRAALELYWERKEAAQTRIDKANGK